MLLQAFAEPSQQGAAPASGGLEEASSADAAAPQVHAQIGEQLPGVVQEPAHAGTATQQQQALPHPQSASAHAAANRQVELAIPTEEGQAEVQADQNRGPHSDHSTFDLPGSHFDDDDPSNPDGKLMSLLMG